MAILLNDARYTGEEEVVLSRFMRNVACGHFVHSVAFDIATSRTAVEMARREFSNPRCDTEFVLNSRRAKVPNAEELVFPVRGEIKTLDIDSAHADLDVKVNVLSFHGTILQLPWFNFCRRIGAEGQLVPFSVGDIFVLTSADAVAEHWDDSSVVWRDCEYLSQLFSDADFCERNWGKHVAVFLEEVVGVGETDAAARQSALETLKARGIVNIPDHRFVVDYCGDW
ncbi:MAG: hypothetical protein KDA88_20580 [Planctomycetaceae bacterium]|nr:hypothetical protein [Planctomycetaceae bacterium]MCB9954162.1 hypothetical protein [Planctomycetaceae bacterium]